MRNLNEYPVTPQEVVGYLKDIRSKISAEERVGDMGPLLLSEAIDCVCTVYKIKKHLEEMQGALDFANNYVLKLIKERNNEGTKGSKGNTVGNDQG